MYADRYVVAGYVCERDGACSSKLKACGVWVVVWQYAAALQTTQLSSKTVIMTRWTMTMLTCMDRLSCCGGMD